MQNLNIEFNHEEIRNMESLIKALQKSEKQLLFICNADFPELKENIFKQRNRNTKVVVLEKNGSSSGQVGNFETIDLDQTKNILQNQLIKIYNGLKDNNLENTPKTLSDRERIIMRELVLGFTNKEIADRLFISPHTVVAHRKNITGKLGIKSVPGLTIYAILHKIISEDDIRFATQPSDTDPHK